MSQANHDQEDFWTNNAGPTWVAYEAPLDAFLAPVLDGVLGRAGVQNGHGVLDIGCGTGGSALLAGDAVGPNGHVMAVDISATMVARAKERTAAQPWVRIELTDAADHPFQMPQFDHVISRFGVMFFADTAAAFENIGRRSNPAAGSALPHGARSPRIHGSPCPRRSPRPNWARRQNLIPMPPALLRCATSTGHAPCWRARGSTM